MKPFLILETGVPLPGLRRHGSFGHWIRVAAGLHGRQVRACRVLDDEPLPPAGQFAGVLVTGSGAMVTERHYGTLEVHSPDQGQVQQAGAAILSEIGCEVSVGHRGCWPRRLIAHRLATNV